MKSHWMNERPSDVFRFPAIPFSSMLSLDTAFRGNASSFVWPLLIANELLGGMPLMFQFRFEMSVGSVSIGLCVEELTQAMKRSPSMRVRIEIGIRMSIGIERRTVVILLDLDGL